MNLEDKLYTLVGVPFCLPDELAEVIAPKLTGDDIHAIEKAFNGYKEECIRLFCIRVLERRTQRERLSFIENQAKGAQEQEPNP